VVTPVPTSGYGGYGGYGGSGGCNGCGTNYGNSDCGCDNGHGGFFKKICGRLGGGGVLFSKHHNNDCGCDSGCGQTSTWGGHGHGNVSYGSSSCGCDSGCGSGHGGGFGGGLRGFFGKHHNNNSCGCDSGCGASSYGTAYPGAAFPPGGKVIPGGEPIGPPGGQPLPPGDKGGKDKDKDKGKGKGDNGGAGGGVIGEPPVNGGAIAIPEAPTGQSLDIVPPAVVPNIPATPGKSPF